MGWWSDFTSGNREIKEREPSKREIMAMAEAKKKAEAEAVKENEFAQSCQANRWDEARAKLVEGSKGSGASTGHSALFWVACGGPTELALVIAQSHGEAFEERDGQTPLMAAAAKGSVEMARILPGQNVLATDKHGRSALHFAAGRGDLALVEHLLEAGATVCGEVLRLAVNSGSVNCVKALMAANHSEKLDGEPLAPVAAKSLGGVSTRENGGSRARLAMKLGYDRIEALASPWDAKLAFKGSMEMVMLAFAFDGGLLADKQGATALDIAAASGSSAAVKFFMGCGNHGKHAAAALRLAARNGKTECVKPLLAAGEPEDGHVRAQAAREAIANGHFICAKAIYNELSGDLRQSIGPEILARASSGSFAKSKHEAAAALWLAKITAPSASSRQRSEALMAGIQQGDIELVNALFPLSDLGTNALVAMEMLASRAETTSNTPEAKLMSALVCQRALSMMEEAAIAGASNHHADRSQEAKPKAQRL